MSALLLALALLAPAAATALQEPFGSRSAFDLTQDEDRIRVAPGTRVRARPAVDAPTLALIDVAAELDVVERSVGWARVRWERWTGWVPLAGTRLGDAAPEGSPEPAPLLVDLFERVDDVGTERLDLALSHLSSIDGPRPVGMFALYTHGAADPRLGRLERIAEALPAAYARRFAVTLPDERAGSVVIYGDEAAYRGFAETSGTLVAPGVEGHAANGVAALYFGDASRREALDAILVHELTHLLNRRVLGVGLPVWLEEGLANDLSSSRIAADGRLELGTWRGGVTLHRTGVRRGRGAEVLVEMSGPLAGRQRLLRAWTSRELPSLEELVSMPWVDFVDPARRTLNYGYATELVRFLLDGGDRDLRAGFLDFLARVAGGRPPTAATLEGALGMSLADLERRLGRRLRARTLGITD